MRWGRFVVFRRFTGSLLEQRLGKGPTPSPGVTVGQAFFSVKESVWGGILMGGGSARIRVAAAGKGPSRAMRGRRCQTATTSARSGGTALDFALVLCSMTGFSGVKPGFFESCPC